MSLIPFATHLLIPPGSSDPRINARIGILHVDAGNAESLYTFFRDRSGGIESHGHIKLTGELEQYRDSAYQADANLDANDFALSFETQGFGDGEWSTEQLATIKRVIVWANEAHGIPFRVVTSWDDTRGGWGYHTLFGAPSHWTPVAKSCPGPRRIKQFETIIAPWLEAGAPTEETDPMANYADDLNEIKTALASLAKATEKLTTLVDERVRATSYRRDTDLAADIKAIRDSINGAGSKSTRDKS